MNQEVYAWCREHRLSPTRGGTVPGIAGAIGIHGTQDESPNRGGVDRTEGCVSLLKRDVEELDDLLPVGARVVIEP